MMNPKAQAAAEKFASKRHYPFNRTGEKWKQSRDDYLAGYAQGRADLVGELGVVKETLLRAKGIGYMCKSTYKGLEEALKVLEELGVV